jgi:cytidine deaminase
MKIVTLDSLSDPEQSLIAQAKAAAANAYAPYSHFKVGAALQTVQGNVYAGCNVEDAAYLAIHAEWAAISKMISAGEQAFEVIAVACADSQTTADVLLTPCGICRQKIFEFAQLADIPVRILCCSATNATVGITDIAQLLPHPFGPKNIAV